MPLGYIKTSIITVKNCSLGVWVRDSFPDLSGARIAGSGSGYSGRMGGWGEEVALAILDDFKLYKPNSWQDKMGWDGKFGNDATGQVKADKTIAESDNLYWEQKAFSFKKNRWTVATKDADFFIFVTRGFLLLIPMGDLIEWTSGWVIKPISKTSEGFLIPSEIWANHPAVEAYYHPYPPPVKEKK